MMTDLERFYEQAIHTGEEDVPAMEDHTAAQFLLKMAAMRANVFLRFDAELFVVADTPLGQYRFCLNSGETELVVDQIL